MLTILAAGSVFFPGLFLLSKQCLKSIPALRWSEGDAVIVSARLVSSVQAVMASSAGYIIASSCNDILEDQHWLTSSYIMFAVPYFVYDIYAMFMCYWYKLRVKGHEEASAAPPANEHGTDQLLAPRVPHGAAPRCHGHRLLPCFCVLATRKGRLFPGYNVHG